MCCDSLLDTAAKCNGCILNFGEPKNNKHDETMQFAEIIFSTNVMQIISQVPGWIISLDTVYCEPMVKMKSPVNL